MIHRNGFLAPAKRAAISIAAAALFLIIAAAGTIMQPLRAASSKAGSCNMQAYTLSAQASQKLIEYAMPQPNSDLMSTLVGSDGNIWLGEMGQNLLGRFNPATHILDEWPVPNGHNGVMDMAAGAAGDIWFAEEAGGFIGHFQPQTCAFTEYPLTAQSGARPSPVGLTIAPDGKVWFTDISTGLFGYVDPVSQSVRTYFLPELDTPGTPIPYDIAADSAGNVWIALISSPQIVRFHPATSEFYTYTVPIAQAQINAITVAPNGAVWFAVMSGALGEITPGASAPKIFTPPAAFGNVEQLYSLLYDIHGNICVTSSNANALIRFNPAQGEWSLAKLPAPESAPYGISESPSGSIWFTEGAQGANRFGVLTP